MSLGRLLLVDDSETVRMALQEFLEHLGYEVVAAAGVKDGLEAARAQAPLVLITDLRLDDGSGLDLVQALKADLKGPQPACVLLTGYGTLESAMEAIRRGADEYLLKPVDLHELEGVVGELVARQTRGAGAEAHSAAAQEALRHISTPLSLLRAYLEMLGEGRFGPLTEMQEEKIRAAHECVRQIGSLVRGAGRQSLAGPARGTVTPAELDGLFNRLFEVWSEDFERRGVQVAWSQPPQGGVLHADPQALKADTEAFMADCLARAGLGMTLRLEWHAAEEHLAAALRLEPAPANAYAGVGAGTGVPPLPLASLSLRLRKDA